MLGEVTAAAHASVLAGPSNDGSAVAASLPSN